MRVTIMLLGLLLITSCSSLKFERPKHNFDRPTVSKILKKEKKKVVRKKKFTKKKKIKVVSNPTYFPSDSSDPNYRSLNVSYGSSSCGRKCKVYNAFFIHSLLVYSSLLRNWGE